VLLAGQLLLELLLMSSPKRGLAGGGGLGVASMPAAWRALGAWSRELSKGVAISNGGGKREERGMRNRLGGRHVFRRLTSNLDKIRLRWTWYSYKNRYLSPPKKSLRGRCYVMMMDWTVYERRLKRTLEFVLRRTFCDGERGKKRASRTLCDSGNA
jgi:hypothetical protein